MPRGVREAGVITVYGFEVSARIEEECRLATVILKEFKAGDLAAFVLQANKTAMEAAAKKTTKWPRVRAIDIADRIADRLITKWKKNGSIVLRRPYWVRKD
jgi:hypothetical protein